MCHTMGRNLAVRFRIANHLSHALTNTASTNTASTNTTSNNTAALVGALTVALTVSGCRVQAVPARSAAPAKVAAPAAPVFTEDERTRIVTFWNAPDRYKIGVAANVEKKGLWQVRLTVDGSQWFWRYQNAIGAGKAPPTVSPGENTSVPAFAAWKTWVAAKIAYDRWQAQDVADRANGVLNVGMAPTPNTLHPLPPTLPGLMPADLLAAVGDAPPFANAVVPMRYAIAFDDMDTYTYQDNVRVGSPSFAYYRFPQGVNDEGEALKTLPDAQLNPLFAKAGFNESEQRVARAVSRLEGGFDSVNTYDTGYVSIGFIQFITAGDGKGSLLEVLRQEKTDQPDAFGRDFHQFGVDVNADGVLDVIDPVTGAELTGAEAVQRTIADKRLTAVWQKAGKRSEAFRVAQIKVAKTHYWPLDDTFTIMVNGQTFSGKVSDVVHSEAGLTTLFDRKVNRGKIAPFEDALARVMTAHNLTSVAQAAQYEREIIMACKYRTDFLADTTLSQPQ